MKAPGISTGGGTLRRKPKLSRDLISQQFAVPYATDNPNYSQLEWKPCDTRFVLWFHLTTNLQFESIAIAFNSTYPDSTIQMTGEDVLSIVEVLQERFPLIWDQLTPNGHWNKPTERGWTPCDHGMYCTKMAALERKASVNRNFKTRTRYERELAEMATTLWQGTWQELLTCPRVHDMGFKSSARISADSGSTKLSGSSKENHSAADFDASNTLVARVDSQGLPVLPRGLSSGPSLSDSSVPAKSKASSSPHIWIDSSARTSRSPRKKSALSSGSSRPSGDKVMPSVEEADPDQVWVDTSVRGSRSSARSSSGRRSAISAARSRASAEKVALATEESGSVGASSYRSAKSHLSGTSTRAPSRRSRTSSTRPRAEDAGIDESDQLPQTRFQQLLMSTGGTGSIWYILQKTVVNITWVSALNPIWRLIMHDLEDPASEPPIIRPALLFLFVCAYLGANLLIKRSLVFMQQMIFRWWGLAFNPPEAADLSHTRYMTLWISAQCLSMGIFFACGLLDPVLQLVQTSAVHFETGRDLSRG
ncbi:hypothetical protein A1O1_00418 [Capronia coronata CBS 617.96]|uniref:Uncharacterized protein n=1 Tax=Capronia coronata CBS 617.96 TaxID=1182541 RepID=W9YRV0_9EURO|nr:uncharacterized protein A1O1_00418 [Capronia coronata CBS 617.96]EXJ95298.1 hypothetical protein A1O1_00418 [Capronia coronata CBS 617.96]